MPLLDSRHGLDFELLELSCGRANGKSCVAVKCDDTEQRSSRQLGRPDLTWRYESIACEPDKIR